jgi:ATP-citrate lyase beta-subunit
MARKKIREYDAKRLIVSELEKRNIVTNWQAVLVRPETDVEILQKQHPWLANGKLVVKPDQLFGKRKKNGLVLVGRFEEVKEYLQLNRNKEITIGKATDTLTYFLIEPFIEHQEEYYLTFTSKRDYDSIYFSETGGIDIEDNWENVTEIRVPTLTSIGDVDLSEIKDEEVLHLVKTLYTIFTELDFSYLEFNPFTLTNNQIHFLDCVAHVDECASFKHSLVWKNLEFPREFGKKKFREEERIEAIDRNSGASLKLTILNPKGKIWNILGGGGASIIYLDMIANLGKGQEIANYGESSGNPSTIECYEYAKAIIELMLKNQGKILFVVGGIANFTDVRDTFKGFSKAIEEYGEQLRENGIQIFVRRGGPHDADGLKIIKVAAEKYTIPIQVHGPETSMPEIIQIAKGSL